MCLNPCFNGRYSQSFKTNYKRLRRCRLNPCFNERYSQSFETVSVNQNDVVLILILMGDTLRAIRYGF